MPQTSAADLAQGLMGASFPMTKEQLADFAREHGAADEILETLEEMPEGEYRSLAEVEKAFGELQ